MTKLESYIFDINESVFGEKVAVQVYCFCSDAFTALCYMLYLTTLPLQFVYLFVQNFKKNMAKKK